MLAVGNALSSLSSLFRNILVARLISVEDFGLASLFALTMMIVEMVSNLSIDKIIVQASDGNEPIFQNTGQAFQVARGFFGGAIMYFAAEYVSKFFNVAHATWAFQVLALIPVIKGFSHLDLARFQREMKFSPLVWSELIPQLLTLVIAWPLAVWIGDYSVMLWIIIVQTVASTVLSHFLSERPYRWSWDYEIITRMIRFGWPLLFNGLLIFVILQGDKAIIGRAFSMDTLGWYSAAFTLTLAPAMFVGKISQSLLLPFLSKAKDDKELFGLRFAIAIQSYLIFGVVIGLIFTCAGTELLALLYGKQYVNGATVIIWLGLMQAVNVAKAGPMITAMAQADTKIPMFSNLVRGVVFLLVIAMVFFGWGIKAVAISGLVGEVLAYFVSMLLLRYRLRLVIDKFLFPIFMCLVASIAMAIFGEAIHNESNMILRWVYQFVVSASIIFICMYTMSELFEKTRQLAGLFQVNIATIAKSLLRKAMVHK